MHELSIAYSIVELAEEQARKRQASVIEEVELEIGQLAGIELHTFTLAMQSALKGSMLEKARVIRHDIEGKGCCNDCGAIFPVHALFSPCPSCGSFCVKIIKGKELRVKSIVIK